MNLHEYQAKQLLSDYGVAIPPGLPVRSEREAAQAAVDLGGARWVVKAQVHAGGRGKAGGVMIAESVEDVAAAAGHLLGSRLVTKQTGRDGLPVETVLVETATAIERELYLGVLVDRASERVMFMASAAGGMDIEAVAAENPEKIISAKVDPAAGLQPYQCRELAFAMGLDGPKIAALTAIMQGIERLFLEKDASQVEINPLVVTESGELLALDAKINLDDNALYGHPELTALRDTSQEDEKERLALQHGLNYVTLDGDIGCMVNGAGLAMATMDLVKLCGGAPANFLDVGGGTTAEKVAEAFKLILADANVKAILVNIFGGIVRCDMIADGIVAAIREVDVTVPVVVRLEGTNADAGHERLSQAGVNLIVAEDLAEAARAVVAAAGSAG